MVKREDYGPVMLLGIYDDDDENGAVVYIGKPFGDVTITVPGRFLFKTNKVSPAARKWIKENSEHARQLGVDITSRLKR